MIDWIRAQAGQHPRVAVGIGDDAALLRWPPPAGVLVTVDMLMEGTDFLLATAMPRQIGHKALAVNLSDIAAMGGRPVAAFLAVALPRHGGADLARGLFAGIQNLAMEFQVALAGGDTNTWDGPLVISITVLGEPVPPGPVLRSGAQPGDWILATGDYGGSLAGKHLDFVPRVREAIALREAADLHAMIDVSDGLAADLRHILAESRVGAVLFSESIPVSAAAVEMSRQDGRTPLEHALGDGEDFELVLTVAPATGRTLLASPPGDVRLTHIGEIVSGRDCQIRGADGKLSPLPDLGWKHRFEASSA